MAARSWKSGACIPCSETDELIVADGFLMPAGADRHVHVELGDPVAIVRRGVTAVRDLAWPAERIFPLADASEMPGFNGPLIRAVGADAHRPRRISDPGDVGACRNRPRGRRRRRGGRGGRGAGATRCGRDQGLAERRGRADAERRGARRDLRHGGRARGAGDGARTGCGAGRARPRRGRRRARAHALDRTPRRRRRSRPQPTACGGSRRSTSMGSAETRRSCDAPSTTSLGSAGPAARSSTAPTSATGRSRRECT